MLITKRMIQIEQKRQQDLKRCESESQGVEAFIRGDLCVSPEDEMFPRNWCKGWRIAKQQSTNQYSSIYRRLHNKTMEKTTKNAEQN